MTGRIAELKLKDFEAAAQLGLSPGRRTTNPDYRTTNGETVKRSVGCRFPEQVLRVSSCT